MKRSFTKHAEQFSQRMSFAVQRCRGILLIIGLVAAFCTTATAQQRQITGTVVDKKGEPMPGVSVLVKGTQTGAPTDLNGKFTIRVPQDKAVLVFSFIGYLTKEVAVGTDNNLKITLNENEGTALNEVVIIGYGQQAKKDVTGSVGQASVTDMQKAVVRSFEESLAGRVAGVQVSSGDGQPGDALNIVIRGNNSVTGNNSPLYVIDGFPIENPDNNILNPNEIETLTVLKDASSTAIYGARGANGVILITTKKGKMGDAVINYNGYYGISSVTKRQQLMNPYQFVQLQNEINPTVTAATYFTNGKTLDSYKDNPGIDWQDQVLRKGPFSNHNLSISGGSGGTRYFISGSYTNQQGVVIASDYKRGQGRISLDQQVNKKLKVGVTTNYTNSISNGTVPRNQTSSIGGNDINFNLLYAAWSYRPVAGSSDPGSLLDDLLDPDLITGDQRINPIYSALNEYNKRINNVFIGNAYAEYSFTKNLTYRVTAAANLAKGRNEVFNNTQTRAGSPLTIQGQANGINGSFLNTETNDYITENVLTYNKAFNKNNVLTATGIYSIQYDKSKANGYSAIHVPDDTRGLDALAYGTITNPVYTTSDYGLQSFAARLNYSWMEKYLFTASIRADGSSKFDPNGPNQYGYFPSGAIAWRLGQEKFIKKYDFISNAKLRASYGVTGNNRIGPYDYQSQITFYNGSNAYYVFNNAIVPAYTITTLGNRDLKWESTGQFDAGLDLGFFKDRIQLELDYYDKRTYDLLLNTPIPTSTGYANITANVGKTQNRGFELTLNTINLTGKGLNWSSSFNISFNKNKILALNGQTDNLLTAVGGQGNALNNIVGYIAKVGKPISQMYGLVYDGNYQLSDFTRLPNGTYLLKDNVPSYSGSNGVATRALQQPGDPKYKDINGDGLVNDNDLTVIGDPNPIHTGGFNNNFTYKNFDLNIFLQWSYGNDIYNANRVNLEGSTPIGLTVNQLATYVNRWTPTNPSNSYYRVNANGTRVTTSRVVEDGSFMRLKTVQLGYTLPSKILQKAGFKTLRAYAAAQNIATLTGYSGPDPEVSVKGYGLTQGYDFSAYPRAFTVTLGLNLSL